MSRATSTPFLLVAVAVTAGCSGRTLGVPVEVAADAGSLGSQNEPGGDAGAARRDAGAVDTDASAGGDAAAPSGLLVGYYADWATTLLPVSAIDWSHLTHVAHAFALPRTGGGLANGTTYPNDALVQAAHANGVKVVASVGGASVAFEKAATTTAARAATVSALAALCAQHGYDGIDVDWEFPDATTIAAWVSFMDDMRAALDAIDPGLTLSTTISQSPTNGDVLPVASLAKLAWVGAMTYRYTGPNDAVVGPYAPLQPVATSKDGSIAETVQHLVGRGVPAEKILVGLGMYGEEFDDGPPGTPIASPSTVRPIDQRHIVPLLPTSGATGWTLSWDATASESSLQKGKIWITYEDGASIDAKCLFARISGLGGAMTWHMASGVLADGSQPLLAHAAGCR